MAGMDVTARLTADTASFDAKFEKSAGIATKTAQQIERAAERARVAWEKELLVQERAAEAAEKVSRRKELATLQADILSRSLENEAKIQAQLVLGLDRWVRSVDASSVAAGKATAANNVLAASHERLAVSSGHGVTQTQAASAAIRSFEGNPGIRAVEKFLTIIPGVGKLLLAAFPIIGAVALGAVIVEGIKKIIEMRKEADELPKHIQDAFAELHSAAVLANDAIALTNDKLAEQLAKLEHKPANVLQTALDTDRQAADELTASLDKALAKSNELLEKNKVGIMGKLMGQAGTEEAGAFVEGIKAKIDAINEDFAPALAAASTAANVKALQESKLTALEGVYQEGHAELRGRIKGASDAQYLHDTKQFGAGSDQRANLAIYRGFDAQMSDQETEIGTKYRETGLKGAVESGTAAKESKQYANKAAELRLKAAEAKLAEWKTLAPVSAKAIYDFWEVQKSTFAAGSSEYNSIVEKQATLAEEGARKTAERIAKFKANDTRMLAEVASLPQNPVAPWIRDQVRAAADRRDASYELNAATARNTARLAEVQIQQASGRTMTQQAAATALAAVHTREYGAELDRLVAKQKEVKDAHYLDGHEGEREKQLGDLEERIADVKAGREVQIQQDQYNIQPPNTSLLVGATGALEEFVRATTDAGKSLHDLLGSSLSSVNAGLIKQITERSTRGEHVFGNVGAGILRNASGALLQGGEGHLLQGLQGSETMKKLLGHFGIGGKKAPTGAAGDQFHVIMDNYNSGSSAAGLDAVIKGFGYGGAKGAGGDGGGWVNTLGSIAMDAIPFFADGVSNFGGGWAVTGENGPELAFHPPGTNIVPNHKIGDMLGGGGDTHVHNYDLRHTGDPAQIHAVMQQYVPAIEQRARMGAVRDVADGKRRSISGRG